MKLIIVTLLSLITLAILAQVYNVCYAEGISVTVEHTVRIDGLNVKTGQPNTIVCNEDGTECNILL